MPYHCGGAGMVKELSEEVRCRSMPGPSLLAGMTCRWYWLTPAGLLQRSVGPRDGSVPPSAGAVRPGAAMPASLVALEVNAREGREANRTAAAHNNLVYI